MLVLVALAGSGSPALGGSVEDAKNIFSRAALAITDAKQSESSIISEMFYGLSLLRLTRSEEKELVAWGLSQAALKIGTAAYHRVEVALERAEGATFTFGDENSVAGLWMLNHEISELVYPTQTDRILFIGSGPFPSALSLAKATAAKVALCDCDLQALRDSQTLFSRLGIGDRFSFLHCAAETIEDFSAYNLIWIALMVPDKDSVLDAIAKTAVPGTKVVVRQALGIKQLYIMPYEKVRKHPAFSVVNSTSISLCESLMLLKK